MAKLVLLLCLWAEAAASPDSMSLLQVAAERKPTRLTEVVKHVEHVKLVKHAEHKQSHSHGHHSHAHHSHSHHSHAHHAKHEESEEMQLVKQWAKDEGLPQMIPGDSLSEIPDLAWPPAAEEEADPDAFAKAISKAAAEADSVLDPPNPGESAEEAPSPVAEGDATNVATFAKALTGMDQAAYEAASHKINQGGYQKIVRLLNTSLMESFITLTVLANGGMVKDPQAIAVMAPEHSGEKGAENFERLLTEVKAGAWNTVGEDVAGEEAARAPLDTDGYELVAALHDTEKMSQFITRVIEANAGSLVDPRKVEWYAKYYSGEKAKQSFKQMVHQLKLVDWVTGMKPLHTKSQETGDQKVEDPVNDLATDANASADAFEVVHHGLQLIKASWE